MNRFDLWIERVLFLAVTVSTQVILTIYLNSRTAPPSRPVHVNFFQVPGQTPVPMADPPPAPIYQIAPKE